VLLVTRAGRGGTSENEGVAGLQTVRVAFDWVQSVLVGLDIGTQGFEEVCSIAVGNPGGVYGAEPRVETMLLRVRESRCRGRFLEVIDCKWDIALLLSQYLVMHRPWFRPWGIWGRTAWLRSSLPRTHL
jgi:hypothetical protein